MFGEWHEGVGAVDVRGRMAKSQRQTATPFSLRRDQTNRCARIHILACVCTFVWQCRLFVDACICTLTSIRTCRHQHTADAWIAGIRGICKIPAAHIATNCCSADRPRPSARLNFKSSSAWFYTSVLDSRYRFVYISGRLRQRSVIHATHSRL